MKFLLLLVVVLVVVWVARRGAAAPGRGGVGQGKPSNRPPPLERMVRCERCGLALPASEAFPGRGGHFCSELHRSEHERLHSDAG